MIKMFDKDIDKFMEMYQDVEVPVNEVDTLIELRNRVLAALRAIRNNPRGTTTAVEVLSQALYILNTRIDVLKHN